VRKSLGHTRLNSENFNTRTRYFSSILHHQINTATMVRYARDTIDNAKSARARGSFLRVSYKNSREAAQAINGWKLDRALKFLENVKEHKEAVPMRRYAGGTGRTGQGMWH
jgi:large subunit ribosomal protein L17e